MTTKPKRKKTGGRTVGTPNKISGELRGDLKQLLIKDFPKLIRHLDALDGKDYVDCYIKLIKIVLPALQSVDLNANIKRETGLEDRLASLLTPPST